MEHWSPSDRVLLQIVPRIYSWVLRLLALTIRRELRHPEYPEEFWNQGKSVIAAFWHQRLLMMPFLPHQGRFGMMISRHRDGKFIARAVKLFGIDSVRGSTTRGGSAALRGMVRFFESRANLAITPDGPQGPRQVVQRGVVELARLTSAPIVPVAYGASRKKVFNTWDHFLLPLPFCRVVYIWGEPIFIPRNLTEKELEEKRLLVEERLRQTTAEADGYFRKPPVSWSGRSHTPVEKPEPPQRLSYSAPGPTCSGSLLQNRLSDKRLRGLLGCPGQEIFCSVILVANRRFDLTLKKRSSFSVRE